MYLLRFGPQKAIPQYPCIDIVKLTLIAYHQSVVIFELLVPCVLSVRVIAFSYIMTTRHLVERSRSLLEET